MAGTKVVLFFLLISLMIFSTHAWRLVFSDGIRGLEYDTEINTIADDHTFWALAVTKKVIIYIKSYDDMKSTTLDSRYLGKRLALARTIRACNYELLYLGYDGLNAEQFIGEFLRLSIKHNPSIMDFKIVTIGEGPLDVLYKTMTGHLNKLQEEENVCGVLRGSLRSISA